MDNDVSRETAGDANAPCHATKLAGYGTDGIVVADSPGTDPWECFGEPTVR